MDISIKLVRINEWVTLLKAHLRYVFVSVLCLHSAKSLTLTTNQTMEQQYPPKSPESTTKKLLEIKIARNMGTGL